MVESLLGSGVEVRGVLLEQGFVGLAMGMM